MSSGAEVLDRWPAEKSPVEYFTGLTDRDLRAGWVPCTTYAIQTGEWSRAEIYAGMCYVAGRLCGVEWPEKVWGQPMSEDVGITMAQWEQDRERRIQEHAALVAAEERNGDIMRAGRAVSTSPAPRPAPPINTSAMTSARPPEDGYIVREGPPPKPAGRQADPLAMQIARLQPGQYLLIGAKRVKKATLSSKLAAARKRGGHVGLYSYQAESGDFVVAIDPDRKPRTRN